MTKDKLIEVAVAAGLYPNKTQARAVPVEHLRAAVEAHQQGIEDASNALDEEVWQAQHTEPFQALTDAIKAEHPTEDAPCPYECETFADDDSKCHVCREDEPYDSDPYGDAYAEHPTDEAAHEADRREAEDRFLARVAQHQTKREVKVPSALGRALHEAHGLPSRNRHERRVREARLRLAQRAVLRAAR